MRRWFPFSEKLKCIRFGGEYSKTIKFVFLMLGVSSLIACAAVVYVVQAYNRNADLAAAEFEPAVNTSSVKASSKSAAAGGPESEKIESEIITILPHGFDPPEITRSEGYFFLLIDNRSGLDNLSLRLRDESATNLMQTSLTQSHVDGDSLQNLTEGEYLLTEDGNPEWLCRITIIK